jgi:hypothetical protein
MRLRPRSGLTPFPIGSRLAILALLALALACSRKHELPGEIPLEDCAVTPVSLEFGTVSVGQTADRAFILTNTGSDTLTGAVLESCPDFLVMGDSGYHIAPGSQDTFTVRFEPGGGGRRSCTLALGPGCGSLPAGGDGQVATAGCEVAPTTLEFGTVNVGQSADRTFTITNTGSGTLSGTVSKSCSDFAIVGSGAYSLAAGERDTFTVRFSPTSGGPKACTVDAGGACADVSASGTGQAPNPPGCEVSPTTLSFGNVLLNESADRTFTVTNSGGGTLSGTVSEACSEFALVGSATYCLGAGQDK